MASDTMTVSHSEDETTIFTQQQRQRQQQRLLSWTPVTTRLLQGGGSSAWNVLDHAIEIQHFSMELFHELKQHGLLASLKPARTQGDVQVDQILSLVQNTYGVQPDTSQVNLARGDDSIFISREYRNEESFPHKHPHLSYLLQAIQDTVQHHLSGSITLDPLLTSVQLAVYPGDGTSGYPRHCDRSGRGCKEETSSHSSAVMNSASAAQRIITAVYYLTPDDWDSQLDGGCLRLFSQDDYYDVAPYSNRLLIFRSDGVEHEVMPSLRRERTALTIWLYGKQTVPEVRTVSSRISMVPSPTISPRIQTVRNATVSSRIPTVPSLTVSPRIPTVPSPTVHSSGPPPLPLAENDDCHSTIFVSIAAYRDTEIGPTIRSLMETAQCCGRVFIGVVLQIDPHADSAVLDTLPTHEPWYASHVRCLTLDARHARGPCYARDLCQRLHQDERYILQIDSHMRFRRYWDTYLIQQLQQCSTAHGSSSTVNQKAMLTTYPVGYQLPDRIPNEIRGTLLVPWKFDTNGMLRQRGRLLVESTTTEKDKRNWPCLLYAAGFNFAPASVLKDCPYDGQLRHLFFGEELSMAVRLYTHGYDLYAPPETVCYHLWSRDHRPTTTALSSFETVEESEHERQRQRMASMEVVRQQLRGQGRGLGSTRTAADFAAVLGVDFETQTIQTPIADDLEQSQPLFAQDIERSMAPTGLESKVAWLEPTVQDIIASFLHQLT